MEPPRTAKWCVNYLSVEGLGFEGHHERLRQVAKVDASSWGIQELFQLTTSLRQALLVDQLDAFNCYPLRSSFAGFKPWASDIDPNQYS